MTNPIFAKVGGLNVISQVTVIRMGPPGGGGGGGGAPSAHASTHAAGGSDPVTPAAIGAVSTSDTRLTNARTPTTHKSTHATGGSDALTPVDIGAVPTSDARLTDARTPTAHAGSHAAGAADALTLGNLAQGAGTTGHVWTKTSTGASWQAPSGSGTSTPTAHKASHATGGTDALTPADIGAVSTSDARLTDARAPTAHSHAIGDLPVAGSGVSSTTLVVRADDSRLSDSRTPTAHTHPDATTTAAGFMSTADKTKLDGISAATNSLIVTGLTGGTAGNIVVPVLGTATVVDAHPSMKAELRRGLLYWKALDGTLYSYGAFVGDVIATDQTQHALIALSGKTSLTGRNWTAFTGDIPAALDGNATQSYVELGSFEGLRRPRFRPRDAISGADTGTTYGDNTWATYALNTPSALTGVWEDIWSTSTLQVVNDAGMPNSRAVKQASAATTTRKLAAYKGSSIGQFADGQVLITGQMRSASTRQIYAALRAQPLATANTAGTETGILAMVNGVAGTFVITVVVNGTFTDLYSAGIGTVTENTHYCIHLDAKGTRIRARWWVRGGAVPVWIERYTDLLPGAGFAGVGSRSGDAYFSSVHIINGYGDIDTVLA